MAASKFLEIKTRVFYKDSNVVYLINFGHLREQYIEETLHN